MDAKKYNIVLDLDDVLLHEPNAKMSNMHQYFSEFTLILSDNYGHNYIFPAYFAEFMKYCVENFNVSFFSSGNALRNECIVEKIWQKVFNCTKPLYVTVLSGADKTFGEYAISPEDTKVHGKKTRLSWFGNTKKDLTKIGSLENTILVDDDPSYVLDSQFKNYLCVNRQSFEFIYRVCKDKNYKYLSEKIACDKFGTRYSSFYKLLHTVGILETAVTHDRGIIEGLCAIYFIDGESMHLAVGTANIFCKKGHEVLIKYSTSDAYPKLEILEDLIVA